MNTTNNTNTNTNTNTTVSNENVKSVIQSINFYTITFEISSWTSERTIAPEEMEQLANSGVPTPVLDALRDKKLGKGFQSYQSRQMNHDFVDFGAEYCS